jgi:hypothetical protein
MKKNKISLCVSVAGQKNMVWSWAQRSKNIVRFGLKGQKNIVWSWAQRSKKHCLVLGSKVKKILSGLGLKGQKTIVRFGAKGQKKIVWFGAKVKKHLWFLVEESDSIGIFLKLFEVDVF